MIVVDLRHVGTTAWLSEVLKISVRTSVSCAAQSFSTRPGMLSGPAAFRRVFLFYIIDFFIFYLLYILGMQVIIVKKIKSLYIANHIHLLNVSINIKIGYDLLKNGINKMHG